MAVSAIVALAVPVPYNTRVVLLGTALLGAGAGLVGGFAVLRGQAMMGDALAHATLPGLCLAFMIAGSARLPVLLAGALASGVFGVALVSFLRRATRIKQDAAIGFVLSVFFGIGVVLLQGITRGGAPGDQRAQLHAFLRGQTTGVVAADVWVIGAVSLVGVVIVLILYKEFKLVAFDPGFARVQGWPVLGLDLMLAMLVAVAVVIGLPVVGVVLMAALLILPAAAARFWTERLGPMLVLASGLGTCTSVLGTLLSSYYETLPAGATIVLVGATLFGVSALLAPRRGAWARWRTRRAFRHRYEEDKLLRKAYDWSGAEVAAPRPLAIQTLLQARLGSRSAVAATLHRLALYGDLNQDGETVRFTAAGLARAARLVGDQRLWELFLLENAESAAGYLDLRARSPADVLPVEVWHPLRDQLVSARRWPAGQSGSAREVGR